MLVIFLPYWPSFYTSWLPLWVDTHIRTFLCTVSSRHVLDHVKTTYEEVYRYIWQTPQVQRQTCTLSLRYKFIRSRCRQFHVLGLNNEEYSTKMVFLFTRKLFLKWSYFLCSLPQFHCLSLYRKDRFFVRENRLGTHRKGSGKISDVMSHPMSPWAPQSTTNLEIT